MGGSAVLGGGVPSWGVLGKVGFCAAGAIFLALEHFLDLEGVPNPPSTPGPSSGGSAVLGVHGSELGGPEGVPNPPPSSTLKGWLGIQRVQIGLFRVLGGMTPFAK